MADFTARNKTIKQPSHLQQNKLDVGVVEDATAGFANYISRKFGFKQDRFFNNFYPVIFIDNLIVNNV